MTMLGLIGLALAPQVAMGGDLKLEPTDTASTIGVFQRVCLSPFPDPTAFKKAVANDPEALERVDDSRVRPAPGTPRVQVAEIWFSKKYTVRFLLAPDMPISIPQPQCVVTARLAATPDASRMAADLSAALSSSGTAVSVKGKPGAMHWELDGPGRKWRVFLNNEGGADGNFMSITLINLRD